MANTINGIQTASGIKKIEPSLDYVPMLAVNTVFNNDGSITETSSYWTRQTTFSTNTVTERVTFINGSWKQKVTNFSDGQIIETVTEGTT